MIRELLPWLLPIGKFILASAVLLVFYRVFLVKRASYRESRLFLLSVAFLALLVSQFSIPVTQPAPTYVQVEQVLPMVDETMVTGTSIQPETGTSVKSETGTSVQPETVFLPIKEQPLSKKASVSTTIYEARAWFSLRPWLILFVLYASGVLILVSNLLYQFVGIRKLRRRGTISWQGTVRVVEHDGVSTPYSFARTIFLPNHMDEHQREIALTHERFHIHHKHYIDVLLQEVLICLFWFNPVLWLIRYELRSIHEFQADRSVLRGGYDIYQYQLVILQEVTGNHSMLTSGFNHSITKKRFLHMRQSEPIRTGLIQKMALVSVVTVLFSLFCLVEGQSQVIRRIPVNPSGKTFAPDSSRTGSDSLDKQQSKDSLALLNEKTSPQSVSSYSSLTFDFSPANSEKLQVLIENINSIYTMTIMNSKINETHYISESLMAELNTILADFQQKQAIEDSLKRVRDLEFVNKLKQVGVNVLGFVPKPDGAQVHLAIADRNGSTSFALDNPDKGTINETIIKFLFKLMNQSFWDYDTETYVEKLEGYFNFGLGVKKQSNSNYKLYGWISSKEEKELNELFDQLPSDIPLYFNMQNFEGMDSKLYKAFKSLCDRNPKITWSGCSDKVKQQFKEAGIVDLSPMGYSIIQY